MLRNFRKDFEKFYSDHKSDIRAINLQLVFSSAALIEGSISSVLIQHISKSENYKKANNENDFELRNILDNLIDRINKSQWRDLAANTNEIVGIDLKESFDSNWEIIVSHFKFRNLIAHGGIILTGIDYISNTNNINEIEKEKREDLHNYKSLFNFLVKYQLIEKKDESKLIEWEFLKTEISDFFIDNAVKLILNFYKTYSVKYPANRFIETGLKEVKKLSAFNK